VGTQTELTRLEANPRSGEYRIKNRYGRPDGLPSAYTVAVSHWRGEVWAATFRGLARQLPDGRWQPVSLDPVLDSLPPESLVTDSIGNLWVGTDGGGVARVSHSGFSSFGARDGLAVRKVWSIFENRQGELMVVAKDEDHYSLNRFDGYRFHPIPTTAGIDFGWSWGHIAAHSLSGAWWLGTGSGLLRFPRLDGTPIKYGPAYGLPIGNMRVFEDSTGTIWASRQAISNNHLSRLRPGARRFENLGEAHGLPPLSDNRNCPASFAEDATGQIWIGMLGGGLMRQRDGRFQQIRPPAGSSWEGVRCLFAGRLGGLWIGARRQGLLHISDPAAPDPVLSRYTTANGLSGDTVHAITEDADGRIYAATGSGVDRLDPKTGTVRRYGAADGLPPGEYWAAHRDRGGALWFGGYQGLFRLEPRQAAGPASILIHAIRVNGKPRRIHDSGERRLPEFALAWSEREMQVDFGGFRHDLLYQTKLSPADQDWSAPSTSTSVHYLSLAPGFHELRIRSLTPEGVVSEPYAGMRFHIAAPVWQRWWFLMLCAAAAAGIIYLVHKNRVAQAVAVECVRTRIASDLHDDIGSTLSQIAILSELARRQSGPAHSLDEPLDRIAGLSREMVDSLGDIVWAINPGKDRFEDLVQRMRRFTGEILEAHGIDWVFRIPGQYPSIPLDADIRREVFLILKEAIHNLVRHSGCTAVEITLDTSGGELRLEVRDNGRGFDPAHAAGLGLSSMRARAGKLGGRVEFPSGQTGGALLLHVPLKRARPPRKYVGGQRADPG
jgi:hypothetical protein